MGLLQQGRRAHQIHGYEVNFQGTTKGPRGAGVASDFTRRNSPFTGRVLSLFPPPTTAGSPPGSLRLLPTDTHSRPTGSPRAIPADRKLQTPSPSREAGRPRPTPPPLPPRSPPAPGNAARTVRLLPTDVHSQPARKPPSPCCGHLLAAHGKPPRHPPLTENCKPQAHPAKRAVPGRLLRHSRHALHPRPATLPEPSASFRRTSTRGPPGSPSGSPPPAGR